MYLHIPEKMKNYRNWILWRLEPGSGGKPTKIPYCINGCRASVSNPATWASYEQVCEAVQKGNYNGIGFVFTGTPFVGIDIDGCFKPDTGELSEDANAVLQLAQSYTERSQSGKGFHIILEGRLPEGRRRNGCFEMYGDGSPRYFAMTGDLWGENTEIRKDQEVIQLIHQRYIDNPDSKNGTSPTADTARFSEMLDQKIIQRAAAAKGGRKFMRLWTGDTSDYSGDDSRADLALCGMLAYWCDNDAESIDRLFRQSKLMRPKWDELRGKDTYGNLTIAQALNHSGAYSTKETKERHAAEPKHSAARRNSANETQAQALERLLRDECKMKLFKDDRNRAAAELAINGHSEVMLLDSATFENWLYHLFEKETDKLLQPDTVRGLTKALRARVMFECDTVHPLSIRVAGSGNDIWYDLTNSERSAVHITADSWEIVDRPPVLFERTANIKPQVMPTRSGNIRKVLRYINLRGQQTLFLCWLVSCFVPGIPHAILLLSGEKGAAKSTAFEFLKQIIDPSVVSTLNLPRNSRDLVVSLQKHWFLPFDNVSKISTEVSDALCRAVTGSEIQQRKLYTNGEDYVFKFQRCIAINGINNVVDRADLLDRSILIQLRRIPEEDRRELSEIREGFYKDLPDILGGVFDVLSKAVAIYPTLERKGLPRMADFAMWGRAISKALGDDEDAFLKEYAMNRRQHSFEAVQSDMAAAMTVAFMENKPTWEGRVSDLLVEIRKLAPNLGINPNAKEFPSQPNRLSRRLNALESNLRDAGISFSTRQNAKGTTITLQNENLSPLSPQPSPLDSLPPYTSVYTVPSGNCGDDGNKNSK